MSKALLLSVFICSFSYGFNQTNLVVEGSVGIGTEVIGKSLEVYGNILSKSSPTSGTAGSFAADPGGFVSFWINDNYNPSNHTSGWTRTLNLKEGKIGIGTTDPLSVLHVQQKEQNEGIRLQRPSSSSYWDLGTGAFLNFYFSFNGEAQSAIASNGGLYYQISNNAVKYDLKILDPVLLKVKSLKPYNYLYKNKSISSSHSIGFNAQDIEQLFPELVIEMGNGLKGLYYDGFAVISIKAIQELYSLFEKEKNDRLIIQNSIRSNYQLRFEQQQFEIDQLKEEIALLKQILLAKSERTASED